MFRLDTPERSPSSACVMLISRLCILMFFPMFILLFLLLLWFWFDLYYHTDFSLGRDDSDVVEDGSEPGALPSITLEQGDCFLLSFDFISCAHCVSFDCLVSGRDGTRPAARRRFGYVRMYIRNSSPSSTSLHSNTPFFMT